ncbi:uncharacterized protein LOC107784148 isoform X1 [Nicotiana tabacum]|uniref:Uncharacterized protein LOC107784148 isoform X1 n=2 Tax=Nicotiana tabacum TaxID=4097 RepID=A0AC58SHA6_TOBAC|nr:PREDICTED: uncharacterized protein LOC107784148 isoform X1 [Nicotiana tabacum]
MAVNSSEEVRGFGERYDSLFESIELLLRFLFSNQSQDSLNVVELPAEGTTGPLCESHLDMVNLSNLNFVKTPISMDAKSNGRNHANLKNGSTDVDGSYILDIDTEKGKSEAPKSIQEMGGNVKTDDCIARMLQREIASLMGGKFMQLLMNHSVELPKFACKDKCLTEKVYDASSNRLRKYKRSASFNSRRVVLLFSFLSSMGTIILIYLTLRVRMSIDGAGNV